MSGSLGQSQQVIDHRNREFWDELCGTQLAQSLGVTDSSPGSLKRFDDWYFDFYPYLINYIPFAEFEGMRVLEVGLGYGSVAQKVVESGADYYGLDIAANPVAMVCHRLELIGQSATVKQGSILEAPFDDGFFDWIIAIGCLHHTGNLAGAIKEVRRVLKSKGKGIIMVYSATSYRQYWEQPWATLRRAFAHPKHYSPFNSSTDEMRRAYDKSTSGLAAPQTEFVTKAELRYMCRHFSKCQIRSENIGADGWLAFFPRPLSCRFLGPYLGLDLYCSLEK
jgi:ubiquinone/menaquinone biosynthesis C-methylase UbiE